MKKNRIIKIKKNVKGLRGLAFEDLYVQLTKDERGMTLSINEYTIPLEPLGIEIRKSR